MKPSLARALARSGWLVVCAAAASLSFAACVGPETDSPEQDETIGEVVSALDDDPYGYQAQEQTIEDQLEVAYTGQDLQPGTEPALVVSGTPVTTAGTNLDIKVTGEVRCKYRNPGEASFDQPVARATVTLKDKNSLMDAVLGTTYTDGDGKFTFTVPPSAGDQSDGPDLYVDVRYADDAYRSANGGGGRRTSIVDDSFNPRGFTSIVFYERQRGENQHFTLNVDHMDCRLFYHLNRVYQHYKDKTGVDHPTGKVRIHRWSNWVTGTPWSALTTINWPRNTWRIDDYEVGHEFGHTVRHALDGSVSHFHLDVGNYTYAQSHDGCDNDNLGFAFNEGWATYWGHLAFEQINDVTWNLPACTFADGQGAHYELEVTRRLDNLDTCAGGGAGMVAVLRDNPGTIHSYDQFLAKYYARHPTCDPCYGKTGDALTCCRDPLNNVCNSCAGLSGNDYLCCKKPWQCDF